MSGEMSSLHQFLTPVDIPLAQIFLDPNNPRFTEADWTYVAQEDWAKVDVQEATQRRMLAEFDVEKLRMSMEVNGFLPIDRVVVKKFDEDKYLVLEGNRRICAAKMIGPLALDGTNVADEVRESLQVIPCLQYTGSDEDAAWIFQGLRHISGVVEWSAFNKAKLLVEQMEKDGLNLTQVGKRFGLTSHGAGQWVRGYYAFNQARSASQFINQVDERSYPYFQELFGKSSAPLRDWLEWKESEYKFENSLNFEEFISWLYPHSRSDEDEGVLKKGDFEHRRVARRDDLRLIASLMINQRDLFEQFRAGSDLEKCYSIMLSRKLEEDARRRADPVSDLFTALEQCSKAIANIPYAAMRDQETKARILNGLNGLKDVISELTS